MQPLDYAIVIAYAVLVLVFGFIRRVRRDGSAVDVIVGGRLLTLPAFIGTLVSAWYGGVLGVGEYSYRYGISNWLVFGVPYYATALLFALFLAKKARETELLTIPDRLARVYDTRTALTGAIFIFLMTPPAAYVLMIGVLCNLLFAWPLWVGIVVGTLVSVVYVYWGGFNSVVRTDVFQFIMMYAGFVALLIVLIVDHGGFAWMMARLPTTHLTWHGGNSGWYIASWYIIAMQTLAEPVFYQRCYAVKDVATARTGIFISIACWAFFDFLTTSCGLYAKAILPNLDNPVSSYPALAVAVLPTGLLGLFIVAMLATIMSTVNAYALIAASTFGNDIIPYVTRNTVDRVHRYTRLGLVLSTGIALAFALYFQSVIDIWYAYGTVATPALLVPMVTTFVGKRRLTPKWAWISIMTSGLLSLLWYLPSRIAGSTYPLGIEPIIPGLVCSIIIYLITAKRIPEQLPLGWK